MQQLTKSVHRGNITDDCNKSADVNYNASFNIVSNFLFLAVICARRALRAELAELTGVAELDCKEREEPTESDRAGRPRERDLRLAPDETMSPCVAC